MVFVECRWHNFGWHAAQLSHVDDLLCGGNEEAMKPLDLLGKELGFGSLSCDEFQYCGKKISQQEDGTIRVSMEEYTTRT